MTEERAERIRLAGVILGGFVIVSIYAFPGYIAYDSLDQLRQARAGVMTDWHPPIMSALWGVLDRIVSGALLMLLLQCGLFLGGLYVLLRRKLAPTRAVVLTLVIFAMPPVLTMMAVILKDCLMAGALLVGCAGLTSKRRWAQYAALGMFLLAAGLRHNAISVVVPLVALLSPWPATKGPWIRGVVGAVIGLALMGSAMLVNKGLTDVHSHPFQGMLAPMDIVNTLALAPDLSDDEVRELAPGITFARTSGLQAHAREVFDIYALPQNHALGENRLYDGPTTDEGRAAVSHAWWSLVTTYPGAYLSSRLMIMREVIGLTDVKYTPVYEVRNEAAMLKVNGEPPVERNVVQRWLARKMIKLGRSSLLFRPYVYLILAIGLLVLMRRDRTMVALLLSGLSYVVLDVVAIPGPDIRYVWWLMVVTLIAVAVRLFGSRVVE
ncbi:MAG: hypothetical protein ABI175_19605 [Polyangiales bacterium]